MHLSQVFLLSFLNPHCDFCHSTVYCNTSFFFFFSQLPWRMLSSWGLAALRASKMNFPPRLLVCRVLDGPGLVLTNPAKAFRLPPVLIRTPSKALLVWLYLYSSHFILVIFPYDDSNFHPCSHIGLHPTDENMGGFVLPEAYKVLREPLF